MSRRVGWLDCSTGAAGDMLLAALVGAGVPASVVSGAVEALHLPVSVHVEETIRGGLAALRAVVRVEEPEPTYRTYADVVAIVEAAVLDPQVRALALAVFHRLARAEAAVHATTPEEVHFHEVGALDALADVVGCAAGFCHLGLEEVVVSPVSLGSGRARTAHGSLPVPVPAVLALVAESGLVASAGPVEAELCTPTGAALLASVGTSSGPMPAMRVEGVGVGAGTRELPDRANVVRLVVGQAAADVSAPTTAVLLCSNVDDLDPRLWPAVLERLLAVGASDAWLTPILMKKGRPAHTLSVLCTTEVERAAREVVFRETSSLGVRRQTVDKISLDRTERVVEVAGRPVRVKVGWLDGAVVNVQPEYEDVRAAAEASGRAVKVVLAEAIRAAGSGDDAPA